MKFGSKLESFLIKEWADHYIRYKYLNRLLKGAYYFKRRNQDQDDLEDLRLQAELFSLNTDGNPAFQSQPDNMLETIPSEYDMGSKESQNGFKRDPSIVSIEIHEDGVHPGKDQKLEEQPVSKQEEPEEDEVKLEIAPNDVSDDLSSVIRSVVESYEEKGHLNFDDILQLRKSSRKLEGNVGNAIKKLDTEHSESCIDLNSGLPRDEEEVPPFSNYSESRLDALLPLRQTTTTETEIEVEDWIPKPTKPNKKLFSHRRSKFLHFEQLKVDLGNELSIIKILGSKRTGMMKFKKIKVGTPDSLALFDKSLRDDIRKVLLHYSSEMEYIDILIKYLKNDIKNRSGNMDDSYTKLLQKAITALWDSSDKLKSFLNTNMLAVYKLLKKKDKLLETDDLLKVYPQYKEIFLSVDNWTEKNELILSLYKMVSEPKKIDFDKMKKNLESSFDMKVIPAYYLWYITGMCTILLLFNLILCTIHSKGTSKYYVILAHLPIFRVFLIFGIIWCAIGWCQNYLEIYGVNYQFLLHLSNNYGVISTDFYFFGALESFICLFIFFVFLLDCKFTVFGEHKLYYLYPILLIITSIGVVLLPKKNFKLKLRRKLLMAILRSFTSPICVGPPVSMTDSILADVYTSLTRPFVDIMYIFSFFIYGIYYDSHFMYPGLTRWGVPIVMSLPFLLRFSQCLRRFIKEHLWFHMGNMIKYISAIICVIVSSVNWLVGNFKGFRHFLSNAQRLVVIVACYFSATLYNFMWDYFIDWGLSLPMNIFKRRNNRKMYHRRSYYLACAFNLLCRFTWALTVTPFRIMEDQDLSMNILILIITLIEIFRRIVWVVFRMETEHLLNSYKYRTALWVPELYKCKSVIVRELSVLNKL